MAPPRLYKTEAIVLRQRRLGEADRALTIYTPTYGKLEVRAKGVRKTTSRMAGHLQPLTRCQVQLAQGRAGDVVAGCQTIESFQGLRDDLESLSRGLYVSELLDRMAPERVPAPTVYRLLMETLRRLEGAGSGDPALAGERDTAVRYFEMQLLGHSGFRPELESCVSCGRRLRPQQNLFVPQSGGAVCPACASGTQATRLLSLDGLKVLRLLQRVSYNEVVRVRVPPSVVGEVERHLRSYIVGILERDLNAAAFIEQLRREEPVQAVEA